MELEYSGNFFEFDTPAIDPEFDQIPDLQDEHVFHALTTDGQVEIQEAPHAE